MTNLVTLTDQWEINSGSNNFVPATAEQFEQNLYPVINTGNQKVYAIRYNHPCNPDTDFVDITFKVEGMSNQISGIALCVSPNNVEVDSVFDILYIPPTIVYPLTDGLVHIHAPAFPDGVVIRSAQPVEGFGYVTDLYGPTSFSKGGSGLRVWSQEFNLMENREVDALLKSAGI